MIVINARNAHTALPDAIARLQRDGIREDSRNGPVLRMPEPVTTVLHRPLERLTFHDWRDSNPFFLNVEAVWMLAGRDDLKPLTKYVARMADYSDDGGKTSPGAYGKRWRSWFMDVGDDHGHFPEFDQLNWVVKRLRANPNDRRVVISMWDASCDPHRADTGGKDVPCNLMILPWINEGVLHLTVFNRSNDIVWGLYSANAVQFSTLLEYLAGRLGLLVGTLTTVSNNFHAYEATMPKESEPNEDPYTQLLAVPPVLLPGWANGDDVRHEGVFQEDLRMLFEYGPAETQLKARSAYLRQVACPLMLAHAHWKSSKSPDRYKEVYDILDQLPRLSDWRLAARIWMTRRELKEVEKANV